MEKQQERYLHPISWKLLFAAISLMIFNTAFCSSTGTSEVSELAAELRASDHKLESTAKQLCTSLGSEACSTLKRECENTPGENHCLIRYTLITIFHAEHCQKKEVIRCAEEQNLYEKKISEFLEGYATKPGIGRAAANICEPFGNITFKSEKARKLQATVKEKAPLIPPLIDNKAYYECVKEQYLKLATSVVKR